MRSREEIRKLLDQIPDPEVPVLNILDLGIVREIEINAEQIRVQITPTYSGCPAMGLISMEIKSLLETATGLPVEVEQVLHPIWTTDWMSEEGKKKLREYGIAPPRLRNEEERIECPRCGSAKADLISQYGSTSCKALYKCSQCLEPFDYFKCI